MPTRRDTAQDVSTCKALGTLAADLGTRFNEIAGKHDLSFGYGWCKSEAGEDVLGIHILAQKELPPDELEQIKNETEKRRPNTVVSYEFTGPVSLF